LNAVTDHLEPPQPLQNAVLVLIFTSLIGLGWLNWLPLGVVVAAVALPFLIRRNAKTQMFAPWASVYAGASAFLILPLNLSNLPEHLSWMALGMVLAFLIGLAFDGVYGRNRWAWLAGLLMLILNPSATGVVGVLGLSIVGALESRASRIRFGIQHQTLSGMVVLAVVGFTLAAFSILLARPTAFRLNEATVPVIQPQTTAKPKPAKTTPDVLDGTRSRRKTTQLDSSQLRNQLLVANVALLMVITVLLIAMLRNRQHPAKGWRKPDWTELIPLFGAFIVVVGLFLLSSNAPDTNIDARASNIQNALQHASRGGIQNQLDDKLEKPSGQNPIFTIIMLLIVVAAAYYAYRITRGTPGDLPLEEPEPSSDSSLTAQIAATNRVREAYRTFLELCKAQGIRRSSDQTSLEFAALVGTLSPTSSAQILALTNLYEPVRYGQLSDETGAIQAERIVKELKLMLEPPPKGEPA
jgi:Domain of unknown function (DUF4129)